MQNDLEILHQFLQVHRRASLLSTDSDPFNSKASLQTRIPQITSGNFLIQVYSSRYDIEAQDYDWFESFQTILEALRIMMELIIKNSLHKR